MPRATFFGPHPDDIEIGASALALRMVESGEWDVSYVILTDEADREMADLRRREAIEAANLVGLTPGAVTFAGFEDRRLGSDGEALQAVKDHCRAHGLAPDLVVVNCFWDDHTDHKHSNLLVAAAFKGVPRLEYPVPNHFAPGSFVPSVFVGIDQAMFDRKVEIMRAHESQVLEDRIEIDEYRRVWTSFAGDSDMEMAEPYQLFNPTSAAITMLAQFNDRPFERFWFPIIGMEDLVLIHGSSAQPAHRKSLREAESFFAGSAGPNLTVACSDERSTAQWRQVLGNQNVLLVDGPLSNKVTAEYFNRLTGLRYRVCYNEPGPTHRRISDCTDGTSYTAEFREQVQTGQWMVHLDFGIITVRPNPYCPGRALVGVAGTTSIGTAVLLTALTKPTKDLIDLATGALDEGGRQGLFEVRGSRVADQPHWRQLADTTRLPVIDLTDGMADDMRASS